MDFIGTGNRILTENFSVGYLYTITFKTGIHIDSACIGIGDNFVMFQRTEPELLFTLDMSTADDVDTIEPYEGGTDDYDELENRPQINSHTLTGNMSGSDLGLQDTISDLDTIRAGAAAGATAVQPAALSGYQPVISDLDSIRAGAAAGATAVQPAALSDYQPKIDITHMLSADLVDDTSATHKFATAAELQQIQTNKNNISNIQTTVASYHKASGTDIYFSETEPTGTISKGSYWISTTATKIYYISENLLDGITWESGTIYADGSEHPDNNAIRTAYIDCNASTIYKLVVGRTLNNAYVNYYTSDNTNISRERIDPTYTFTTPNNCAKIRLRYGDTNIGVEPITQPQSILTHSEWQ